MFSLSYNHSKGIEFILEVSLHLAQLNPENEFIFQTQLGSSREEGEDLIICHCLMSLGLCGKESPFYFSWTFKIWSKFH